MPFHLENPPWPPAHHQYWAQTLLPDLLASGAVTPLPGPTPFVSRTYLEPKSTPGEFRHIVDLRPINRYLVVPKCRFESISVLPDLHAPGEQSISFDLKHGYYALGIAPHH